MITHILLFVNAFLNRLTKEELMMTDYRTACQSSLSINHKTYHYFSLAKFYTFFPESAALPVSLKILLENLIRHQDEITVKSQDIEAIANWGAKKTASSEIAYRPARVLMQDFTGVPAVVDLAAMRDALNALGGDPEKINPLAPVDLVIDHSIQVDAFGNNNALQNNTELEMRRNHERYEFLRWGQKAFQQFRVVPPETGICHQVNLEYLAKTIFTENKNGQSYAFPDTVVGTDSHTTMVNGLGVLGWGVGGIEAEAAMLGQPVSMLIPEVIGVKLVGQLKEGVTATDLVLTLTELLRKKGVVGKFVEYFGEGLSHLPLADRATIANMAPEYGATCGFFPIDQATLDYLNLSGRDAEQIQLVEEYAKIQGLWRDSNAEPVFTEVLQLDLNTVVPSLAGPKRPQDRVNLGAVKSATQQLLVDAKRESEMQTAFQSGNLNLHHGDVVIAAITSCTNTSNPHVLMAAGLLAKKAIEKGLKVKPHVKTSLAPGSQVVMRYLQDSGLQTHLDQLGFQIVGYGCTTCIGNSGPLPDEVSDGIQKNDLIVSGVLSGNRNFEGRIHPLVKANWLASPPLVIAFALAGTTQIDLDHEPLGVDANQNPVYLRDIWPSNQEIAQAMQAVTRSLFAERYANVFSGSAAWQSIPTPSGNTYTWHANSTYIQNPPYFQNMKKNPEPIRPIQGARILALFGDSITTDHISPAGSIKADSPAGKYLQAQGVGIADFNSYGARRGNHEVMMRGTFANIRIKNEMLDGKEGGFTKHFPSQEILSIYDAAMRYQSENISLIVIAGKEYGTGSSRDWAAKGPKLQGIRAVIAESFERIHRSNLVGMGILPLQFMNGETRKTLGLDGSELIDLLNIETQLKPGAHIQARIQKSSGEVVICNLLCRIDTQNEFLYYQNGGILQYVLRSMI